MDYQVKIVLDSIAPCGKRLISLEATYPRFIHSEVLTHRMFARNSASSRAIPYEKLVRRIKETPVVPLVFGAEQKGMQTGDEVPEPQRSRAQAIWLRARDAAVACADALAQEGVHKSLCNRIVEPYMWMTTLITATEWKNFFRLRCHKDAEIHFQKIAYMIRDAIEVSTPKPLAEGAWHLPYIGVEDWSDLHQSYHLTDSEQIETMCRISSARCARLSYLTHDTGKRDIKADLDRFVKLQVGSGAELPHASPTEHIAQALSTPERSGPFIGWKQFRKLIPYENLEG